MSKTAQIHWLSQIGEPLGIVIGTNDDGDARAWVGTYEPYMAESVAETHIRQFGAKLSIITVKNILKTMEDL